MNRIEERDFWNRKRPQRTRPALLEQSRTLTRMGVVLFLLGLFAVFVEQAPFLYQVILGAPIFEEFLKLGLVLLLLGWTQWLPGGVVIRALGALAVGFGFGVLEHVTTYPDEGAWSYGFRLAFHALTPLLSVLTLAVLQPLKDTRVRFLALVPSVFLHYVNNYAAVLFVPFSLLDLGILFVPLSGGIVLLLLVGCFLIPAMGRQVRAYAQDKVLSRFPPMPPFWRDQVAERRMRQS